MQVIGAKDFKALFKRGIENLIKDRKQLNDINVFPVPDGDTGDNLACTVLPVYEQIDRLPEERIDALTAQLSSQMLLSARGNSGVIFSQFFSGFSKAVEGEESLNPVKFAAAMQKATEETYLSLESPKEGTILTVIRHSAEEFGKGATEEKMFPSIFNRVRQRSRQMLEKTRHMLPQLKKAGVIDAGGLGFYLFIEGMANYFREKKERLYELTDRYFHTAKKFDTEIGSGLLRPMDSPKRAEGKEFFQRAPETLWRIDRGRRLGQSVQHPPAYRQPRPDRGRASKSRRNPQSKNRRAEQPDDADRRKSPAPSSSIRPSIFPNPLKRQNDFTVVPIWISIGADAFRDKVTLGREEFYRRIQADKTQALKTSQPAPAEFKAVFESVLRQSPKVLAFTLSSGLSGTHQSAAMGIRQLPPAEQQRILLIDTENTSAGSGLLVLRALELLHAGKTCHEIGDLLRAAAEQVVSLGYVETLDYAVRGGRAPKSIGFLARILGIKALVKFEDGVLKKAGILFRSRNKEKKVVRKFVRRLNPAGEYTIGIAYSDNPDVTDVLFEELEKSGIRIKFVYKIQAGAALGAHAGPGTFCLWALPES